VRSGAVLFIRLTRATKGLFNLVLFRNCYHAGIFPCNKEQKYAHTISKKIWPEIW